MKKQYILALLFLLFASASAFGQKQLKGKVKDSKGAPIISANVNLKDKDGNIISFTRTDSKGEYNLSLGDETKDLSIEATIIGYEKKAVAIAALNQTYDLVLQESEINLKPVVVKNRPALTANGDTLNYKTSDFADKQDRTIGDVLKKMPGIEVAENGKISYNGKNISNLYLDGDNVLDDKYGIATKSVPHGAVDKVQVIEKDQPIKMLRKNNMSDDVALNLVMKDEARLKVMGDIKAGLGTPERFDGSVNAMMFKKNTKFINNIKGNNIGIDPGIDLTSFNDFFKRQENDKPGNFLSAGAAGVPTLPQNRSLFNKAGLINLNNLFKFNQDLQLKANVSYLYDDRSQQYNKFSETYLPGQTIRYTELQNNSINPQKLHAQFNLNSNAEEHYLNNTFIADYNPFKTTSEVFINGTGASQSLSQRMYDISNEFNYRRKIKSNMVNFYSYVDRSSQPETLNIRPGLNENILNNNTPYAGLNQYISFPTWFTNNYFSFALVNGKFSQTYRTGFNWQNQKLGSELYRIQNDQTTELVSADMTNDLDWTKFRTYTEANYEYAGEKLKAGLSVPISYNKIDYNDASHALDKSLEKFFINPVFNVRYQTGIENYVTANYGFKNDLGGLDEVYRGTILKNYRSLFANDAPISEKKTHFAGAAFNFRKAMQMFFFSVNANYSNTTLNTISSYTLTNSIQQRIVLPLSNRVENFSLSANSSKYLFGWRSTVNAGLSFSQTKLDQLLNNELLPFTSETVAYKAGIESKLTNFMTWSYNATYSVNTSKSSKADAITTKYQQLRQQSGLTATMFRSLFVNLNAEHIFTHQASQPDLKYIFADLNLRYRFIKIKTDREIGIPHLATVKKFEAINLSVNSLTSGTYYIPGRVAMLKATFNF